MSGLASPPAAEFRRIKMTARHHHYLSQCYLKGFTRGGGKKSKLIVIDLKRKKHFRTIPRNVGGIRDFNRIDIEGIDQNILEKSLAAFESVAAASLRKLDQGEKFEGETRNIILNLMAMFAIRSPEMREHWRKFHEQVAERLMDLILATKERWESQVRQLKESGVSINDDISYEEIKKFHDSKAYRIEVAREYHIWLEFIGIEAILPYLDSRNWLLVRSTSNSGPFITTDNPVNLSWKEPDKIPPFYRTSPGYGLKGTQVYFPVSKKVALVGEFDGPEGIVDGSRELVALLNSRMLLFTYKQIYSPTLNFYFMGKDGIILDGRSLLKYVGA